MMHNHTDTPAYTDGGSDRDWPIGLINLVEDYGHVPLAESVNDDEISDEVRNALTKLHEAAEDANVLVDELLLELKRLNSVSDGIPQDDDIRNWDEGFSVQTYRDVFGSTENAIEFALAAESGDLMLAIDEYYKQQSADE